MDAIGLPDRSWGFPLSLSAIGIHVKNSMLCTYDFHDPRGSAFDQHLSTNSLSFYTTVSLSRNFKLKTLANLFEGLELFQIMGIRRRYVQIKKWKHMSDKD